MVDDNFNHARPDGAAAVTEQPMPTRNGNVSIQSIVRADLEARERVGVERYGTPLQPHNGRDALRDAYEEALDLSCYLRQAIFERDADPVELSSDDLWEDPDAVRLKAHRSYLSGNLRYTILQRVSDGKMQFLPDVVASPDASPRPRGDQTPGR